MECTDLMGAVNSYRVSRKEVEGAPAGAQPSASPVVKSAWALEDLRASMASIAVTEQEVLKENNTQSCHTSENLLQHFKLHFILDFSFDLKK